MIIVFSNNREVNTSMIDLARYYRNEKRLTVSLKNGEYVDVLPATDWDLMRLDDHGIRVFYAAQRVNE